MNHTPGPWKTLAEECDKPYIRVRGGRLGSRYKIANVITPVYDGSTQREADETRANARLIAAAPDLLEALKKVSTFWNEDNPNADCPYDDVDAAIAKATGENP
ncbi:hypothetical protein [Hymenobacter fodinae]|uniref:Uncharacterized protein n=1 Tax=Hymenobacter fodinae TaxID=2510796 RepID=A0A4Z0P0D5_9BACT|nr:hypothetical protein [Hymenobacter fodinae]TGE04606.1 hypothetical protein EU556_20695 [Hymenobacter fodinae]